MEHRRGVELIEGFGLGVAAFEAGNSRHQPALAVTLDEDVEGSFHGVEYNGYLG